MLVGVAGPARAGKDTVGRMLAARYRLHVTNFAEPIRRAVQEMFSLTHEHLHGSLKEVEIDWIAASPRRLMQTLGTEWGRDSIDPDIWLKIAAMRYRGIMRRGGLRGVVFTDVRFNNEAQWVRAAGGRVIHISRLDLPPVERHSSENGVRQERKDLFLENNGTENQLFEEVMRLPI